MHDLAAARVTFHLYPDEQCRSFSLELDMKSEILATAMQSAIACHQSAWIVDEDRFRVLVYTLGGKNEAEQIVSGVLGDAAKSLVLTAEPFNEQGRGEPGQQYGWSVFVRELNEWEGCSVVVDHDDFCESPRENGNIGVMFCFKHRRYDLGDKDVANPRDLPGDEVVFSLPLYLYDHSGITMNHASFNDRFDSGIAGEHYVTRKVFEENWPNEDPSTVESKQKCRSILESELKEYDEYLRGETWEVNILDRDGDAIDGTCGFIGSNLERTSMKDYVPEVLWSDLETAFDKRFAA